jgi:hypothetical protein
MRRPGIVLGVLLLAAALIYLGDLVSAQTVAPAPTAPPAPLSRIVPHSRWLARCAAVPVSAADGIEVMRSATRPGVRTWWLRKGRHRGVLAAYRIGAYQGAGVYAVHGPTALRERMAAAPECSHAIPWGEVASLPRQALEAIAPGLVCCGEATRGGATVAAWRCDRSAALGGDTRIQRLDGYGPGVVAGGSPCSDYSAPE